MTRLRPFWRYYGGKHRAAHRYPPPEHEVIVAPFAGSAGYASRYPDRRVVLVDSNPKIAGIWRYLIAVSAEEVLALPDLEDGASVEDMPIPEEARWLVGFWCGSGGRYPLNRPTSWATKYGPGVEGSSAWAGWNWRSRERVASQVDRIRHWTIIEGDYRDAPDVEATWFIDPPYNNGAGREYPAQPDSFEDLGAWCRSRRGLVIACEQRGADWLPFQDLGPSLTAATKTSKKTRSNEVIWLNRAPIGWGVQQRLFGEAS